MQWKGWFWTPRRQRESALFVWKRLTEGVKQFGCRAPMSITQIALLSGCRLVTCVLFAAIICPVNTCEHDHQLHYHSDFIIFFLLLIIAIIKNFKG
ncbi:hypothetical protein NC652_019525 [Populus alba x Populus x berolinensis]|nr:hypothetical protein NC652_019525 [Populus alba x Populus x berolinensis]